MTNNNKKIYTFDIYDTAIERTTFSPRGIFTLIENKVGNNFKQKRIEAEFKVRLKKQYHTLEEVYELLPEFDIQDELQTELENSYANPEIVKIYNQLPDESRYFVSDMYLSGEQLKPILENCGYKNPKVFSSIDFKASKSEGGLYDIVQGIIGQIDTHYGDNYKSDIVNAKKHGVKNVVFNPALHKYDLWTPKIENNPILSRRLAKKEIELGEHDFFLFMYRLLVGSRWYYLAKINPELRRTFVWIDQRLDDYLIKSNCVPCYQDFDLKEEDYILLLEKFVHEPISAERVRSIIRPINYYISNGELFDYYNECEWKEGLLFLLNKSDKGYKYLARYFTKPSVNAILSNRNTDTLLRHISEGQEPVCFVGDVELIRPMIERYSSLKDIVTIINECNIDEYKDMINNQCICYTVSTDQDKTKQWLIDNDIKEDRIKRIYK